MPFAAKPWFGANIVSVENTGEEEFSDLKVFFRQYAPWYGDWAKGGYRAPQNVWKAPSSAVWIRSSDGAWCGAATYAPTVRNFVYWISGEGAPHPDAMFSPQGATRLAAGARWEPRGQVWMVAAAGTGGPDGWRRFLVDGGELHSPKMTGDRYVDVGAFGQVVVTNGGSVTMPEGVQWLNGLNSPGKLTVANGGSFAVDR